MSEKRPKQAPKSPKNCAMCTSTPKPRTVRILGYVAQKRIPRAPSPPATPHFSWFLYQWSLGAAGGPASPRTVGANGGSTRVPRAKQKIFSKVVPRPLGMLKQVFLVHFEPVVARFGAWKIPKCLENGPFWDQQWVKNGSKTRFSESDPGPFGMLKQVFLARFEPILTEFSHIYAPLCALHTYLGAVWWSHVEFAEGCRLEDIYIYIYISIYIYIYIYRYRYIYIYIYIYIYPPIYTPLPTLGGSTTRL